MSFSEKFKEIVGVYPMQWIGTVISISWKIVVALILIKMTMEMARRGI